MEDYTSIRVSDEDKAHVLPILNKLDPRWWEREMIHQALAQAFVMGHRHQLNRKTQIERNDE